MISYLEWSSFRSLVTGAALALLISSPALAARGSDDPVRDPVQKIEEPAATTYVLHAFLAWGDAQERAVTEAGGTVVFRHAESGVGIATSVSENFLQAALLSGAFEGGSADARIPFGSAAGIEAATEDASAPGAGFDVTAANPNDETLINSQWSLTAIHARDAWSVGYDGQGVRVAVIDGGTCASHVDLDANLDMAAGRSFVPGRHFADDATGFRRACYLAGIIAAEDNNAGVIGVAPKATIIPCKVLHNGSGTFDAMIEAILYAADPISEGGAGANIILIGFGALIDLQHPENVELSKALTKAIKHAKQRNVLVITGAGDDATDLDALSGTAQIPAQSGALAVAGTGPVGFAVGYPNGATNFTRPAGYTNTGRHALWLAAPGGDAALDPATGTCRVPRVPSGNTILACPVFDQVVSTGFVSGSNSVYTWSAGTGAAAAHVAGVAALVFQRFPGLEVGELKAHLAHTADDAYPGLDPVQGRGFVNAGRAVTEPLDDNDDDGDAPAGEYVAKRSGAPATPVLALSVTPHPVASDAMFAMTLPVAGRARLELFDLAGRNIALLFDGDAQAGTTTLRWDGRGRGGRAVSPGAYFAKLSAAGGTQRRIVVVAP
jgi:subtilisin family serine protease